MSFMTRRLFASARVSIARLDVNVMPRMAVRMMSVKGQQSSSLETFEVMSAIFNQGSGGAIQSAVLKDKAKLKQVFSAMDKGNAGLLSRSDFREATELCTMLLTEAEIDKIFDEIDTNKSNTIELDEFTSAIGKVAAASKVDMTNVEPGAKVVMELWAKYMDGNARAAQVFTSKLRKDPSMDTLENVELDRQVQMVYGMVGNTFKALANKEKLTNVLTVEGARHAKKFSMDASHYAAVRLALFATLPEIMGDAYTPAAGKEFAKQFAYIETTLVAGMPKY